MTRKEFSSPANKGIGVRRRVRAIPDFQPANGTGLHLLFASGKRPSLAAIRHFVETHTGISISHDPCPDGPVHLVGPGDSNADDDSAGGEAFDNQSWVELLSDGLTFDLHGIAPGRPSAVPEIDHQFDLKQPLKTLRLEALHLFPGQHLAGAGNTGPIARGMIELARDFIRQFDDLKAVLWQPSSSAIGSRFFESITTAWLDGGAFPAPGLVTFRDTFDGAVQSIGLDFWTGQEIRIEEPLSLDKAEAGRLGVLIINRLVPLGGLDASERVIGLDGNTLMLRPSRNGRFVCVSRD